MTRQALDNSTLRPGSDVVELRCNRCGTKLVPALRNWRCPRMSACGYGGVEEQVNRVSLRPR